MTAFVLRDLPDFKAATVLVFGDLMLDQYFFGETGRISPEAPVPIVNIQRVDSRPGGAANVALNLGVLGVKVILLGITGNDAAANTLRNKLLAAGVHCDFYSCNKQSTITKQRIISHQQQLMRLDIEKSWQDIVYKDLLAAFIKYLPVVDLVIISDYGKGTVYDPQSFIKLARTNNLPILIDPKGNDFSIYANATLITPNISEFTAIVGPCYDEQELVVRGRQLLKNLSLEALLLTRGDKGMTLLTAQQELQHLPAYAHEVYDVTGAGDTVIAVLGAALAVKLALPQAVSLANLAASVVVSKLGTATVSVAELTAMLPVVEQSVAMLPARGLITLEQLLLVRNTLRALGKKLVFTNGCFDILHAGHVSYLQQARDLGDYLVVAINDDPGVTKLKGLGRPINKQQHRAMLLAALSVVDWVIIFTEDTPEILLASLQPDFLVKGGDYNVEQIIGADIVQAQGGKVRVLRQIADLSTSKIVHDCRKLT
jgi:D-beta-D-heptose 7-phosphate kinase/D-beta-D-heptose 1-phosphate adenosyltransferase